MAFYPGVTRTTPLNVNPTIMMRPGSVASGPWWQGAWGNVQEFLHVDGANGPIDQGFGEWLSSGIFGVTTKQPTAAAPRTLLDAATDVNPLNADGSANMTNIAKISVAVAALVVLLKLIGRR